MNGDFFFETVLPIVLFFLITVFVSLTLWFVVSIPMMLRTDAKCLAAGYPKSDGAFNRKEYCIKRVDGTDVVVPVEQLGETK